MKKQVKSVLNEYRTKVTNRNSVLIDADKLAKDVKIYCNKVGITLTEFLNARGICKTVIPKSVRTYWSFDKGVNDAKYTELHQAGKIADVYSEDNYIGRMKNEVLDSICKGIKKDPSDYILIKTVPLDKLEDKKIYDQVPTTIEKVKEFDTNREEDFSKEINAIQTAVSPLLTELRIMNTYLERLLVVWEE